ncbi:MAG: helix-turn-helix domain-containing protein, partial [Ghiorsea sp.]
MNYTQLTQSQRYQIAILKKAVHFQVEIARLIGVNKSTISRELRRNQGRRGYRPNQAHRLELERRAVKVTTLITAEQWQRIESLLRKEWSQKRLGLGCVWEAVVLSAMNGFISMSMRTRQRVLICTAFSVVKRNVRSVMVPTIGEVK